VEGQVLVNLCQSDILRHSGGIAESGVAGTNIAETNAGYPNVA